MRARSRSTGARAARSAPHARSPALRALAAGCAPAQTFATRPSYDLRCGTSRRRHLPTSPTRPPSGRPSLPAARHSCGSSTRRCASARGRPPLAGAGSTARLGKARQQMRRATSAGERCSCRGVHEGRQPPRACGIPHARGGTIVPLDTQKPLPAALVARRAPLAARRGARARNAWRRRLACAHVPGAADVLRPGLALTPSAAFASAWAAMCRPPPTPSPCRAPWPRRPQDDYAESLGRLQAAVVVAARANPQIQVEIFVHKADSLGEEGR